MIVGGFIWKLILSPIWGVSPYLMDLVGLKSLFSPWLGKPGSALIAVSLISVWQYVGIPMMLIYAALLNIPEEAVEAVECDGVTGWSQFFKIKLPLILPAIGIISILTFVGNFNAFDLVYTVQGALRPGRTSRRISSARCSIAPSSVSSFSSATARWARRSRRSCSSSSSPAYRFISSPSSGACVATSSDREWPGHVSARNSLTRTALVHLALASYAIISIFPVFLTLINSMKDRNAIFRNPMQLPTPATFDLVGYTTVLACSKRRSTC